MFQNFLCLLLCAFGIVDNGGCQSQLFFGCDVVNDKCWCGEKTACNGQPPFQYPTRHSCERQFSSSQQESTTRPDIEMTDVLNISGTLRPLIVDNTLVRVMSMAYCRVFMAFIFFVFASVFDYVLGTCGFNAFTVIVEQEWAVKYV